MKQTIEQLDMFPGHQPKRTVQGKVFVVQQTDLDLTKATRFGELVPILPRHSNISMSAMPVIRELRRMLKGFSDDDFILPNGDPLAIGLAVAVAAEANRGRFRALKWDKRLNDYYVVSVDMVDRPRVEV